MTLYKVLNLLVCLFFPIAENEVMQGILFELFEDEDLLNHYEQATQKLCVKAQEGVQQVCINPMKLTTTSCGL